MHRPFAVAFVTLLAVMLCAAAQAQPARAECDDGKCIQIGSFNIELLGAQRYPYRGTQRGRRSEAQLDQLAERIADSLDLEVIAFQEINTKSDQWARLRDKLAAKGYKFYEGQSSERDQYVVLAWDADEVQLAEGSAQELDVSADFDFGADCQVPGQRRPVAARFKAGEFDFWVVGVHLKSRRGDDACTTRVRSQQCREMVAKIDELVKASGERDVIIAGDCNENLGHASFEPLAEAGFASQMQSLAADSGAGSYIKTGRFQETGDLVDHVWLRGAETTEVVKDSAYVMPLESADEAKQHILELSDHVPVWVSFRVDKDLD